MSVLKRRGSVYGMVARAMILGQVLLARPVEAAGKPAPAAERRELAAAGSTSPAAPVPTPTPAPPVKVNRTVPKVKLPLAYPLFSEEPTTEEIFRARVFEEPLVPVGGAPDADENRELAQAISSELRAVRRDDPRAFEAFLAAYPDSPWRASLLLNLGMVWRGAGFYSRALKAWDEAWGLAKEQSDRYGKAVADRALGEWMEVSVQFGRVDELEKRVAEIEGRDVGGSAGEKVEVAKEGLAFFRDHHQDAIPSGPAALDRILALGKADYLTHPKIQAFPASHHGANLPQLSALAGSVGLPMQAAYRNPGAEPPARSLMHWKLGHFSAVVRVDGESGQYLIHDPILGSEMWLSRRVLEEEGSGYFLVPGGALPKGFRAVGEKEGSQVRGKCGPKAPPPPNGNNNPGGPPQAGGGSGGGGGNNPPCGMAVYSFHELMVSLSIRDIPVTYTPPRGPAVSFHLSYAQREGNQPQIFYYSNFGPKWTFDFMSHVIDNPGNLGQPVSLYLRGGGKQVYTNMAGGTSDIHPDSHAVLVRTGTSPIRYERQLPDGSVEVFGQGDGAATYSRRVFMTEWIDAQGNKLTFTYDEQLRLVAIGDAIGQVTTLSHELTADPLKITRVTDPFGRFATFAYDDHGRLVKITDVIGLSSEFDYGPGDFIQAMTTPYGTTSFSKNENATWWRSLEATDPLGGRERLEYRYYTAEIPGTEPVGSVPAGMAEQNVQINVANSFFWGKRTMAEAPGDYTKAHITKWLLGAAGFEKVRHSTKRPLEGRVWYAYGGNSWSNYVGTLWQPTKIGRVLDDGQSQVHRYEYNALGQVVRKVDPAGRTTLHTYAPNGIDRLEVRQVSGQATDLLSSSTYNDQHQMLTMTSGAGQTTTFTYNPAGQVQTVVTPPRAGLTLAERTTSYGYDSEGVLQGITDLATGDATTYTYDAYGRVRTATDPEGYTRTFDYDIFDRPTRTTYPDGTYEETQYDRLDAVRHRDRLGRWTHVFYDTLRRVAGIRDPAGRTTTKEWCACATLERLVDANGNATRWEHDLQGRVVKEIRANGAFKTWEYETTSSRLKRKVDAKLQETRYTYAVDDQLLARTYVNAEHPTANVTLSFVDPATGQTDAHGRLRHTTDGTGSAVYTYQPFGQLGAGKLASVDGPLTDDTLSYAYDELGRVKTRTLNGVTTTWTYDALGRLSTVSEPIGDFSYGYVGSTGRVAGVTYPNGQTTGYAYLPVNQDGRLREIHNQRPGGGTLSKFSYAYDAVGNITTWTQQADAGVGLAHAFEYDRADQLVAATRAAPLAKRYAYAYDPAGNRTVEQIDDQATLSAYDNLNRLLTQVPGGGLTFRGMVNEPATVAIGGQPATVSGTGQFSGTAPVASATTQVTVRATDASGNVRANLYEITQTGATRSYSHDGNGNLTGDGPRTYEWDAENRLVAIVQGALRSELGYDGLGRRVRIVEKNGAAVTRDRRFVWCDLELCEQRDGVGAAVQRRYHAQGFLDSTGVYYYTRDHLGSVREVLDGSGTALQVRYEYDPWGRPTASGPSPATFSDFTYTGHFAHAESGHLLAPYRSYQPALGRWISQDPAGMKDGANLFRYVHNQPISGVDPTGLWTTGVHERMLDTAFNSTLSSADIQLLKTASALADYDQSAAGAIKHAMRDPSMDVATATAQMQDYICAQLNSARAAATNNWALLELGLGMHTIMDATSPSHKGMQPWGGTGWALLRPWRLFPHLGYDALPMDHEIKSTAAMLKDYYEAFKSGTPFCDCK